VRQCYADAAGLKKAQLLIDIIELVNSNNKAV
jgi:hypothetical protein